MGAYVYASGQYHPLEGNQIVSGGQLVTMKENDEIVVNGSSIPVGNPVSGSNLVLGEMVSGATSYEGKTLKDCIVLSGGTLTVSNGKIRNLQVTSGGTLTVSNGKIRNLQVTGGTAVLSSVTDITRNTQLTVEYDGKCIVSSSIITSAIVNVGSAGVSACVGSMIIADRGSAVSMSVDGGLAIVSSGGFVSNISVTGIRMQRKLYYSAIDAYVGYANIPISGDFLKGYLIVSGGTAANIDICGAELAVISGGYVSDLTVRRVISSGSSFGGFAHVFRGGMISGITVLSGGALYVNSGGYALNVVSSAGADIAVSSGGVITYADNN